MELTELRDAPGGLGDPWRALEALPGVVPVMSGLPYVYLRGSPPSGTLYLYDEIPVPSLYHLAIGPAVVHPRMLGPLTLYSGVAPARWGRATGGVVTAEGPKDGPAAAEAELRLLDVSGYARAVALGGTWTGAVRYGYPALILSMASPEVSLAYWDYQARYASATTATERLELVAIGAHDALQVRAAPQSSISLTYHRIEARYLRTVGSAQLGAAVLMGWERSALGSEVSLEATRVGPRVWFEHGSQAQRLRMSADMQAIFGALDWLAPQSEWVRGTPELGRGVRARSVWGAQAEWTAQFGRWLELQAGARGDLWIQSGNAQVAADPRVRLSGRISDAVRLHLAAGTTHQPEVPFIPLPGLSDLPLSTKLQSAWQGEAGVTWDAALRLELQAFVHRYLDLTFTDTRLLSDVCGGRLHDSIGGALACRSNIGPTPERVNGYASGVELFVRRAPAADSRISGYVSYTLAFATLDRVAGFRYTPPWNVRHVGNLVVQWRIGAGWSAGLRWFLRSGKSHGEFLLDDQQHLSRYEQRLPWFTRIDLELAYGWRTQWGRMRVALEWLNATLSREAAELECSGTPRMCTPRFLPPIAVPNLGLRGEL